LAFGEQTFSIRFDLDFCEVELRRSNWAPSIVPGGDDHDVYLVLDDFGRNGRAWREANVEPTDLRTVTSGLLSRQFKSPVRVISFNTGKGWWQNVSADVARELRRADARRAVLPSGLRRR
jgi:hypothetical protein